MTTSTSAVSTGYINHVVRLGMTAERNSVYARIEYRDGRLSICGVEGPLPSGNCKGSAGQCVAACSRVVTFAPGWDAERVAEFVRVWERWHLNDMRAGSVAQEEYLQANPITELGHNQTHYDAAGKALADAGLNPDADGYKYGSAWKCEAVPADVLTFLANLPAADRKPAWV